MHYFMVGFCQGLFLFSVVQDHSVNVKLGELGVGQLRLVLGLQAGGLHSQSRVEVLRFTTLQINNYNEE